MRFSQNLSIFVQSPSPHIRVTPGAAYCVYPATISFMKMVRIVCFFAIIAV